MPVRQDGSLSQLFFAWLDFRDDRRHDDDKCDVEDKENAPTPFAAALWRAGSHTLTRAINLVAKPDRDVPSLFAHIGVELVVSTVCQFMTIAECAALASCSKELYTCMRSDCGALQHIAWRPHRARWCVTTEQSHRGMLLGMYHHYHMELLHLQASRPLLEALQRLRVGAVRGVVSFLAKFPTPALARAVALRRRTALFSVVVDTQDTALAFRHANRDYRGAVSFIPLASMRLLEPPPPRPRIVAQGFVGYATELMELRGEDEDLRETVFATYVFRDMTVWDAEADVRAALASGAYASEAPFYALLSLQPVPVEHLEWADGAPNLRGASECASLPFRDFRDALHRPGAASLVALEALLRARVDAIETALGW